MLKFFPAPYPDELLYSVLARYHLRSGNLSTKETLHELFGSTTVTATVDLPSHLDSLITRLPPLASFSSDSLIIEHTLFPYYAPFLKPEIAAQINQSMKGHQWGDIHTRCGIAASHINRPAHLRFCHVCFQTDEKIFGEPYWHRVHQLPGALVCPTHEVLLHNSTVRILGGNRHEFVAADTRYCIPKLQPISFNAKTFGRLLALAQDSASLLKHPFPSNGTLWLRQQYSAVLIDRNLAIASGRVKQNEFHLLFRQFYDDEMLRLVESGLETDSDTDWLASIVRKHRKAFHPLRHLLLMRFLDLRPERFWGLELESKSFGAGPWACFNGAANHYRERVITQHSISWSADTKRSLGHFSCDCGFSYSTGDPDVVAGLSLKPLRVKSFGSIWENKLKELAAQNPGLRELARQIKVDPQTVLLQCRKLGLPYRQSQSVDQESLITDHSQSSEVIMTRQDARRTQWQALRVKFPAASVTELRKNAPAIWTWLYRHDFDWLQQNSPAPRQKLPPAGRVSWQTRDEQVALEVQRAVTQILAAEPLQRVTKSKIGKLIGKLALLEQYLDKLPQTKSLLSQCCESREQYRVRRIRWAISKLCQSSARVRVWEVSRLAGLRAYFYENEWRILRKANKQFCDGEHRAERDALTQRCLLRSG